jgi:hypothetical protein
MGENMSYKIEISDEEFYPFSNFMRDRNEKIYNMVYALVKSMMMDTEQNKKI